jgi:hypothetical protein
MLLVECGTALNRGTHCRCNWGQFANCRVQFRRSTGRTYFRTVILFLNFPRVRMWGTNHGEYPTRCHGPVRIRSTYECIMVFWGRQGDRGASFAWWGSSVSVEGYPSVVAWRKASAAASWPTDGDLRRQHARVLDRHLPGWKRQYPERKKVAQAARYSAELNLAPRQLLFARPPRFGPLLKQMVCMSPRSWAAYLRHSTLPARCLSRLRAQLARTGPAAGGSRHAPISPVRALDRRDANSLRRHGTRSWWHQTVRSRQGSQI